MGNVTGTEAQRAFKLRKKMTEKKKISDEDKQWLDGYQKRTGNEKIPSRLLLTAGKLPSEQPPLPFVTHVEVGPGSDPATSSAESSTGEPEDGELFDVPPPLDIPGYETPTPRAKKPSEPPGPTEEQKKQAGALAHLFVQTVLQTNAQLKAEFPEAIVLPEPVILQFIQPAVHRLAEKYVPVMDVNSDIVDGIAVGVTAALSIGQLHVRRANRKKTGATSRASVRPPIDVTPVPEKYEPAPPSDFTAGFGGSPSTPMDGGSPANFGANLKSPWGA